ncbi:MULTISPECIES: sugar phosphate isomerase/epimerase family protein [Paenibacillus]|uniref:sugar phosphate isomerase/epimerase family protein n=1 Tax=Paenibacillus TaxID=44249 RepID=UPI0020407283|nr:sugar phosphate isomerase/epimerase [Paenibacillus camelliae]MCM3635148.1 sugar phosphate isomerase/epimerase [Paenibacillus camelliae]
MKRMNIGVQLYTLRDQLAEDFEGTLRHVAGLGYEGVEFFHYGDIPAARMKELLDELGLKAIGCHIQLSSLKDNLQAEIDYLKTIGSKYAICPWLPEELRSVEAWQQHLVDLAAIGKACTEQGIELMYHNHDFEFSTRIDGQMVFEALFERVPAEDLKVEMDIGWVQFSGIDPVAYIQKYAGRLPLLHLKDYLKESRDPEKTIDTVELGEGDLPLEAIVKAASDADVEWIIVEQDSCTNPPLESVATSMNWLKKHYLNQF